MTQFIFIAYFPSAFLLLAPTSLIFCLSHLCLSILSNEGSEKIEQFCQCWGPDSALLIDVRSEIIKTIRRPPLLLGWGISLASLLWEKPPVLPPCHFRLAFTEIRYEDLWLPHFYPQMCLQPSSNYPFCSIPECLLWMASFRIKLQAQQGPTEHQWNATLPLSHFTGLRADKQISPKSLLLLDHCLASAWRIWRVLGGLFFPYSVFKYTGLNSWF